jgi:hypothetical protein
VIFFLPGFLANGGTGYEPPYPKGFFGRYFGWNGAIAGPQVRRRVATSGGGTLPGMQRRYTPPAPPPVPAPSQPSYRGMLTRFFSRPTARTIFATSPRPQPSLSPRPTRTIYTTTRRRSMPFTVPFLPGGSGGGLGGLIGAAAAGVGRELLRRAQLERRSPTLPGVPTPTIGFDFPGVQTGLTYSAGCGCLTPTGRKGRIVYDSRQGGMVCKQVRRLNPANGRAAIRAVRRISATHKLLRRIEKAMAKTCRRGGVGRRGSYSFGRRRTKKSCS